MLLIIASIITLVYWVGFAIYKILCAIRVLGAFIFDKKNYWVFLCCVLILLVGSFLVAQFWLGLDPFGKFISFIQDKFNFIKKRIFNPLFYFTL